MGTRHPPSLFYSRTKNVRRARSTYVGIFFSFNNTFSRKNTCILHRSFVQNRFVDENDLLFLLNSIRRVDHVCPIRSAKNTHDMYVRGFFIFYLSLCDYRLVLMLINQSHALIIGVYNRRGESYALR